MAKAKRDEPEQDPPSQLSASAAASAFGAVLPDKADAETAELARAEAIREKAEGQIADRARAKAIRELFADCDRDTLRDHLIVHSATVEEATAARKQIETDDYTSPRGGVFGKLTP